MFGSYVEDQIAPLLLDLKSNQEIDPIQFTSKIIFAKTQVDVFVANSLRSHLLCTKKVGSLFGKLLNEFPKSIQFLATYIDFELKKGEAFFFSLSLVNLYASSHQLGFNGLLDDEIETKINSYMNLLKCIASRDIFLKFYEKDLSIRLFIRTSVSKEAEKKVLERIQLEWGYNAAYKIKNMLQDIETSIEINQKFHSSLLSSEKKLSIQEFTVQILTQGSWPKFVDCKIRIPEGVMPIKAAFEEFYFTNFKQRSLTWIMSLGHAEISASFDKQYTLVVSNYQYAILDRFNRKPFYKFKDLMAQLEMDKEALIANLLAITKTVPILRLENNEKVLSDTFSQNILLNR